MIRFVKILVLIVLVFPLQLYTQDYSSIDSLLQVAVKKNNISSVDAYNELSKAYYKINFDTAVIYANKGLKIAKQIDYKKGISDSYFRIARVYKKTDRVEESIVLLKKSIDIKLKIVDTIGLARAYNNIGLTFFDKNMYDTALYYQKNALKYYKMFNDSTGIGRTYNNIGSLYLPLSRYEEAIKSFQDALAIFERMDHKQGIASCNLNIGNIYDNMGNFKDTNMNNNALEYYEKALKLFTELNFKFDIASSYNNIGTQYNQKASRYMEELKKISGENSGRNERVAEKYFDIALDNYLKALDYYREIDFVPGEAKITNNLGVIYLHKKEYNDAYDYFSRALRINTELNNKEEIAINCFYIGYVFKEQENYNRALEFYSKGLGITDSVNNVRIIMPFYESISEVYDSLGDYKKALDNYKMYTALKDTMIMYDNVASMKAMKAEHEAKSKEQELKLKEVEISEQKAVAKRRQVQTYAFAGFAVMLLGLALLILRSSRQRKKSNIELEKRNILITEQKKEITDSIHYASRIQAAILPPEEYVEKLFSDQFILFKPRDIVSGDFFWMKEFKHNDVVIATAADCTGHGVPGAFMSMLGVSFLNEIVNKPDIQSAADVLNQLREYVISSLHQTGKAGEAKDGMDISLIAWHKTKNYIEFAGANNPLYLVRNGELLEYKGDKMPIGIHIKNDSFSSQKIEIQKSDCIYMFSDGYADQFGGPLGKKFKYKPFKKLLLQNSEKKMSEQKKELDRSIEAWKSYTNTEDGLPYKQIDDIVVVGIRF